MGVGTGIGSRAVGDGDVDRQFWLAGESGDRAFVFPGVGDGLSGVGFGLYVSQ